MKLNKPTIWRQTGRWFNRGRIGARPLATTGELVVSRNVRTSSHDNGLTLLAIDRGLVLTLNQTASLLWNGLVAGRAPSVIAADISQEFGIPEDRVHAAIVECIQQLRTLRLVSLSSREVSDVPLAGQLCR